MAREHNHQLGIDMCLACWEEALSTNNSWRGFSKMTHKPEVIKSWIEHVNNEGRNLTKWELDFMESITEQFEERNSLSDRQEEILERIYTDKTP